MALNSNEKLFVFFFFCIPCVIVFTEILHDVCILQKDVRSIVFWDPIKIYVMWVQKLTFVLESVSSDIKEYQQNWQVNAYNQ